MDWVFPVMLSQPEKTGITSDRKSHVLVITQQVKFNLIDYYLIFLHSHHNIYIINYKCRYILIICIYIKKEGD